MNAQINRRVYRPTRSQTNHGFVLQSFPWSACFGLMLLTGLALSAQNEAGDPKQGPAAPEVTTLADGRDDLDRELFGPEEKSAKPNQPRQEGGPDDKESHRPVKQSGGGFVSKPDNPMLDVARRMRQAESLIAQNDSGNRTQQLQERIVLQLQELLQKKCGECAGGPCAGGQCDPKAAPPKAGAKQSQKQQPEPKPGETKRLVTNLRTPKGEKPVKKATERPTSNKPVKPNFEEADALVRRSVGPPARSPARATAATGDVRRVSPQVRDDDRRVLQGSSGREQKVGWESPTIKAFKKK